MIRCRQKALENALLVMRRSPISRALLPMLLSDARRVIRFRRSTRSARWLSGRRNRWFGNSALSVIQRKPGERTRPRSISAHTETGSSAGSVTIHICLKGPCKDDCSTKFSQKSGLVYSRGRTVSPPKQRCPGETDRWRIRSQESSLWNGD